MCIRDRTILARMSACRSACHRNNFRKSRVSDVSARIHTRMSVSVSWNSSFSPHRRVALIICTKFQSINIAAICRTVYSSLTITDPLSKTAMHSAPIHRRQCTRFETKRNLYTLGVFLRRKSTLSEQQMRAGDLFQVWTIGHHHMTKTLSLIHI